MILCLESCQGAKNWARRTELPRKVLCVTKQPWPTAKLLITLFQNACAITCRCQFNNLSFHCSPFLCQKEIYYVLIRGFNMQANLSNSTALNINCTIGHFSHMRIMFIFRGIYMCFKYFYCYVPNILVRAFRYRWACWIVLCKDLKIFWIINSVQLFDLP